MGSRMRSRSAGIAALLSGIALAVAAAGIAAAQNVPMPVPAPQPKSFGPAATPRPPGQVAPSAQQTAKQPEQASGFPSIFP